MGFRPIRARAASIYICSEATRLIGRVRDQPGLPAPEAKLSPHLPRFQVIEIEALSIRKNLDNESGIVRCGREILFRVESHVFAGEEFESK